MLTKVGEGTTFEISLARRFGEVEASGAEQADDTIDGAGRLILLVEDDTAVRFALAHLLRRLEFVGHDVDQRVGGVADRSSSNASTSCSPTR